MTIFNPDMFGWAQWTVLVLMILRFGIGATQHGKDRKPEKYNGFAYLFHFGLWMFLLTFGGFFK